MTPHHARPKAYRNLYRARPVAKRDARSETEAALQKRFDKESVEIVHNGWKHFWDARGIKHPPNVSKHTLYCFDVVS